MSNELVSTEWLAAHLTDKNIVILDSSPNTNVTGILSPFDELCIPDSRFFNIKANFTNGKSPFPNTIPNPQQFERECRILGINNSSKIVVYDNLGIYTSPRVWWLFKVMGHECVSVLDGGLTDWIKKRYKTIKKTDIPKSYELGNFKSQFRKECVISYKDIIENIRTKSFLLVDARSEGRFKGVDNEPRKHLKSGNIPNSINIPFKELLEDGRFKSRDELKEIFNGKVNNSKKLVFSCGSGLTACIAMLASEVAFKESTYLYDGSWTEYAELQNLKVKIR